jgi:glycosyltransferase involved in cell wall biosynthesis
MKKHICMIAYTNYSVDARVQREAETLAALPDYNVSVIALKEAASPETRMIEGVEVREVNLTKYRGKSNLRYLLTYFKFLLLAFLTCSKLMVSRSIDVIHIHNMPNFLIFSAIVPLSLGKKSILDIHDTVVETYSSKFDGESSKFSKKMFHRILCMEESVCCSLADRIICVNHIQRDALIKRGIPESKMIISMNVPDPKRFTNSKDKKGESVKDSFRLVYFGTLTKRLGIDLAIHAIARLNRSIPGLQFFVLGEGEGKQDFIRLSENLGIKEVVHFSETFVPHDELLEILEGMDLVVIPNRKYPATELMLPVKMLEGIALDKPVIVPRLRTIEYYFSDDQVFYFEADNIDSLSDAILTAYLNGPLRSRKAENAKSFLKTYGWETHKFDLINLYKSLE